MDTYNWLQCSPQPQAYPVDIKTESSLEHSAFSLLSPPSSPPIARSAPTETTTFPVSIPYRGRSKTSIASSKRVKPYPVFTRDHFRFGEDTDIMANNPWSPSGSRGGSGRTPFPVGQVPANRRSSSDGDQHPSSYGYSGAFATQPFGTRSSDRSQAVSSTSSLTGAMGNTHLSSHSEDSDSPSPTDDPTYPMQGVAWNQPHASSTHTVGIIPDQSGNSGNMPYHGPSSTATPPYYTNYNQSTYNQSAYINPAIQSMSPNSPPFPAISFSDQQAFPLHPARPPSSMQARADTPVRQRPSRTSQEQSEEIRRLNKKVRELELINESGRLRQKELELELANDIAGPSRGFGMNGLPSPILTPSPQSPGFQASWKARTDARIRQFCSLNRAGNALCAWHDSRRERRAYPPRMAPPGHLNCGCTYEEALFEESLSRHGVGSYHPGENVRMDPALRNPLLKLLQNRYGYRDGDFERDITTGNWVEGEGHELWERKAVAGVPSTRKNRGEDRP